MQITMKDRVAVVTGGSKGIGIAVARRFAESGAKVAILARGAQDLKAAREQLGKEGLVVRDYVCDVSKAIAREVPALLTSTSILPWSFTILSQVAEMSCAFDTSQT